MKTVSLLFCTLAVLTSSAVAQKKVVCYWYTEVPASQINPSICTHIIYSFLGLDANGGLNHLHRSESQAREYIRQLVALKAINPNLKVLAAIGGYDESLVSAWSNMAGSLTARSNFASNILSFLQSNNLNGIDIDWEYPNFYQSTPADKANLNTLLTVIKQKLGSTYSLSIAIGAGSWRTGLSYDIPAIFAAVDFVNLMSYDLHGGWEAKTGIHAGLYRSSLDNTASNVHESVKLLLDKGISRDKLIVGIPAYGNAFKLANSNNNGVGASASGAGSIKFFNICQRVNSGSLKYVWDNDQRVPYAYAGTEWVGYDDVKSVTEKANYIKSNGLGGAMIWDIDSDDYNNVCGFGKYPLISAIYNTVVGGGTVVNPTTKATVTVTTTTTKAPSSGTGGTFSCPSANGYFKHPTDCAKYYQCASYIAYLFSCPAGTYFNTAGSFCDWPSNVKC